MNANPYSSPAVAANAPASSVELFTLHQVGAASFLGTPLAGAALLALNEARLDRPGRAVATIVAGAVATLAIIVAAVFLLSAVPAGLGTVIGLGYMLAMRQIAHLMQGAEMEAHEAAGRPAGSVAEVVGITVLSLGSAALVLFTLVLAVTK